MMKTVLGILLILLAVAATDCRGSTDDAALFNYAKRLNVATLDSALPSQPLGEWLVSGPPRLTKVEWDRGCDIKREGSEPRGGWPLCVRVQLRRGELWGRAIITVGTVRSGIHGKPRLEYLFMTSGRLARRGQFWTIKRLSEFPRLLAEVETAHRSAK